jgi:tRNA splicing endonuclease
MHKFGASEAQRQADFYDCRARARFLPPNADQRAFIFDCLRSKGYTITFSK